MDVNFGNDFGFTTVDATTSDQVTELQGRLRKVKELVIPLLENLMIDPKRDIHWPNRDEVIGKLKDQVESICNSENVKPK